MTEVAQPAGATVPQVARKRLLQGRLSDARICSTPISKQQPPTRNPGDWTGARAERKGKKEKKKGLTVQIAKATPHTWRPVAVLVRMPPAPRRRPRGSPRRARCPAL